ncbi:hypothetical protein T484DRAFT_1938188 [Baffinella frigidus]|nr:hypothetical protein T484DRAFT_1938188 [Cryptophyta sp. CCMP2293]
MMQGLLPAGAWPPQKRHHCTRFPRQGPPKSRHDKSTSPRLRPPGKLLREHPGTPHRAALPGETHFRVEAQKNPRPNTLRPRRGATSRANPGPAPDASTRRSSPLAASTCPALKSIGPD